MMTSAGSPYCQTGFSMSGMLSLSNSRLPSVATRMCGRNLRIAQGMSQQLRACMRKARAARCGRLLCGSGMPATLPLEPGTLDSLAIAGKQQRDLRSKGELPSKVATRSADDTITQFDPGKRSVTTSLEMSGEACCVLAV